ncbi:PilZ domain-containing protein [Atopomonas sediminilitoris]|uniref:PilZ domain-containing protein n=1 Tax=Atopomonas sediminilitoris TaxID=2919919 RepID=UPI001F4DF401|nr:PilZ domain-containing protein [Atopomonas sediminilitoris]MCJ8170790.1 PilZ domain-containing protein [Atopomonas sediminilitoris]
MSMTDRAYSEKRDFIRMQVEAGATLIYAGRNIPATCKDLSSTGLHLEAACTPSIGEHVEVQISSDHPSLKGLEITGEIKRVDDLGNGLSSLGILITAMR